MLVIHPSDRTTDFLRTLYEGREDVRLLTGKESRKELGSILFHLRPGERAMLLGHGTDAGLFRLEEDGEYRLYVGHTMAYALRKHPVIGIWCHADLFARKELLHGLFSGMIVSEMPEAQKYGIVSGHYLTMTCLSRRYPLAWRKWILPGRNSRGSITITFIAYNQMLR